MIRKPNIALAEYKAKYKNKISQTTTKKQKQKFREKIKLYSSKWNEYNKFDKKVQKTKERIRKDWKKTQSKLKGKSVKQRKRLISNYHNRKTKKLYFKEVGNSDKFFKVYKTPFNISTIEIDLITLLNKDNVRSILIKVVGKNQITNYPQISGQLVTLESLQLFKRSTDNQSYIEQMIQDVPTRSSAVNIKMEKIIFHIIYIDSELNKKSFKL